MSTTKKIVLTIVGVLSIVLGTGYFLGLAYFQTHFKIGTTINGFHCSFKSVDDAQSLLSRRVESYAIAVETRNNGVEKISAEDVGMSFVGRADLVDIINNQNYKLWFVPELDDIKLPVTIDDEKLKERISDMKCMSDIVKSEKARVVETEGVYQVAPSVKGTELDKDKTVKIVETAIRQLKDNVNLEDSYCYIDAEPVDEDTLKENCKMLNSIRDVIITYDFGDRKETIDIDTITENFLNSDYGLDINKIEAYITDIAKKYDTIGVKREFVTYDEKVVPIEGGDYGWKIDVKKTAEKLLGLIKDKTVDVVNPEYIRTAVSRDKNDIGRSYLEIDKNRERAVLYVEGNPVVQTQAQIGPGVAPGFYSIHGKNEFNSISFGNGVVSESGDREIGMSDIGIPSQDMFNIFAEMKETWPIVVY